MKLTVPLLFALVLCLPSNRVLAQCTGGKTSCSLNWDYLYFFPSAGLSTYTNLANSQTQKFAFGTQKLTITHNYTGSNALGDNTTNTAETGSFGTGADINFSGNGVVTFTFQSAVDSIRFSLYDIDDAQIATITSAGAKVTLSKITGSVISFLTNNTASASAVATSTSVINSNTDGTVNVLITSLVPLTTFSIAVTSSGATSPVYWVSDISACSPGTFNNTYFQISKPYTNQSPYVLMSKDSAVFYVDATTGKAKHLFTAPSFGPTSDINALAYDPVKHYAYYIRDSTTQTATNKVLYRYHYDMDTAGPVMSNVNSFFPTFDVGVESGGAAFYDSSLYFGVDLPSGSSYKAVIWRIDFDAAANPIAASQLFAMAGSGHDWGDFAVAKGTLFNFDNKLGQENYHHQDLYSKSVTVYTPAGANLPKQTCVDWNSNIYSVGDSIASSPFKGQLTLYNENGTLNTASLKKVNYYGAQITGQWRDGAEAFKPKVDFGDAPATYDPIGSDPGTNEISNLLYLGNSSSNEWVTRGQTVPANSDNFDDGMVLGSVVNPTSGSFFTQVKFFNNTGSLATICAWVDFNNNGVYDAGEGQIQTNLPSSASSQNITFNWSGVSTTLTNGSYTYVRYRIALTSEGMGVANATGFFGDGEVEDYRIIVTTSPLEVNLISLTAVKKSSTEAYITWQVANEKIGAAYTLQRSSNKKDWKNIIVKQVIADKPSNDYEFTDETSLKGIVYYRLNISFAGSSTYSETRMVNFAGQMTLSIKPNPASSIVEVVLNASMTGSGKINLFDATGRKVLSQPLTIAKGNNEYPVNVSALQDGLYWMHIENGSDILVQKLFIKK